jgi:putative ABC transport system permease protein
MNTQIILAGLRARPVRTAVGLLAVTLEVILILILSGLTNGALSDTGNRVARVGGDIIFKPKDSSMFLGMSGAIFPVSLGEKIAKQEGVQAVAPVVAQLEQTGGMSMIWGIDPPSFEAVSGGFMFLDGGIFTAPDQVVIDDRLAGARKLSVGQTMETLSRTFTITGIFQNGKGSRIFIPIQTAQEMVNRPDSASVFFVKLKDRSQVTQVKEKMDEVFPGRDIIDSDEWLSLLYSSNAPFLGIVFDVILFIGVSVGVLVIFLSMYTTVTERTREIGILRAIGASKGFIVLLVIQESLILCFIGAIVGIGSSFLLMHTLRTFLPTLSILITSGWVARAAVFALLSGVIGSLYPAYKAASQDPIEALAYE